MADEVPGRNTIRVFRDGPLWCALIGPDAATGVLVTARSPFCAAWRLVGRLMRGGYSFDPTWKPRRAAAAPPPPSPVVPVGRPSVATVRWRVVTPARDSTSAVVATGPTPRTCQVIVSVSLSMR